MTLAAGPRQGCQLVGPEIRRAQDAAAPTFGEALRAAVHDMPAFDHRSLETRRSELVRKAVVAADLDFGSAMRVCLGSASVVAHSGNEQRQAAYDREINRIRLAMDAGRVASRCIQAGRSPVMNWMR